MIEVNIYENGFLINGHAREDICELVSLLGWHTTNAIRNIDLDIDCFASGAEDKNSRLGLSFLKAKWNPIVKMIMDNFYETMKIYIVGNYGDSVKINDYRNENYGVGEHSKYFTPTKEYYDKCFID